MASIGHIAVGMVAARAEDNSARQPGVGAFLFWSTVSLLPDVDVIGFSFGVRYGDPWGHRGATHSLAMAVLLGLAAGVAARAIRRPPLRTAILTTGVLASHVLLDTMTDGGLGCALFWPFDLTRYFAPWRPIPVAPIGAAFFTAGGAGVAAIELVLFAPLFVLALWPRHARLRRTVTGFLMALWAIAAWLLVSTDPVREAAIGAIVREDTAFSDGFSERAFRAVRRGDAGSDVIVRLGRPVRESWYYTPALQPVVRATELAASAFPDECLTTMFEQGRLTSALAQAPCRMRGIERGMSTADVERRLGPPAESCWSYSWSPGNRPFRVRMVCFVSGRVDAVVSHWN